MPTFLTPYLFWIKLGAVALALAGAFGGGMWLEGTIKDRTILTMERDQAKAQTVSVTASLNQLQTFITSMQTASADYGKDKDALLARLDQLHIDFAKTVALKALPADCVPDPDRLRILSASVAAANAAAAGHILSRPVRGPQ